MNHTWFILFVAALSVSIIVWSILNARERTKELTQVAPQFGFTFMGKAWHGPVFDPRFKTCLLQRSRGGSNNVMVGMAEGLETILFDYTYHAGKSTITQTLACFSLKQQLPPFALKPEGLFDRLGDALVHNDIDFGSNPEFSRRYALKSPDEPATRRLFTPSLLSYMERIPADQRWAIEANGSNLFIYRLGRTVDPANLQAFLHETSTVARTIFASDGLKNPVG